MNGKKPPVLIIDDDKSLRASVRLGLSDKFEVSEAASGSEGLKKLSELKPGVVLLDLMLPDTNGLQLLKEIKDLGLETDVIMITADNTVKTAVKAIKQGAFDFITKPFDIDELIQLISKVIEIRSFTKNTRPALEKKSGSPEMIGESRKIKELLSLIGDVADSSSTILIHGETGTGKELVARAIHSGSKRSAQPFIALNCAAIPENLLESELFGYEKGSFTGAFERHIGKFEIADQGTLFLDEIGSLPHAMQAKLLRVLQEKAIDRLGAEKPVPVDTRIIAATNSDLKSEVDKGRFREDLYYRLNVIPVSVPPLRERPGDIALLAGHFLAKFCRAYGKKISGFSKEAADVLESHAWPGNVRELENLVERLVVLSKKEPIGREDLPLDLRGKTIVPLSGDPRSQNLKEAVVKFEKDLVLDVLKKAGGSKKKAAQMLGIHRNTLAKLEKKLK